MAHADLTGWCARGDHQPKCTGKLLAATGYHWWCVCTCHPEPPTTTDDERKAHKVWEQVTA